MRNAQWGVVMVTLFAMLAGCGGGSGGDDATSTISGQVVAPGGASLTSRAISSATGALVTLGTVNADGTVFTPLSNATATTDDAGHYSIPLPAGVTPGPQLNVVVGDPAAPAMASVVMESVTDIRPATFRVPACLTLRQRSPLGS
jgi:hypothetical protein